VTRPLAPTRPRPNADALPRIGVTLGDPAGIGAEVAALALRALGGVARVTVYGDRAALERAGGVPPEVEVRDHASAPVEPGRPDPAAAKGVVEAIESAAGACLAGELDALVTGPISKEITGAAGYDFPGHTELLERIAYPHDAGERAVMLLSGGDLRVALATIHCALREVPERLTTAGIERVLGTVHADLERRFGIPAPRIAVCGLNPHAGEGGRFGDEEGRIIEPAVARARAAGIDARGPFSADSLFHRAVAGEFDAVLGMYHDQALAPLKLHAFGRAVNVTLGLPLIRTSVDHGTAFDIAGKGRADPGSMHEAITLATELVENQQRFDDGQGA
jgi:4-hydroxythreonine-4-phosphate dehydrogenase